MPTWSAIQLLPGLWVLALSALLAAALRRWYDPVPRRCWLAFAAVTAVLLGPALLGGRVVLPLGYLVRLPPYQLLWQSAEPPPGNLLQGDLVLQIAPWLVRVREAYGSGEWPLWNALAGAGEPLLANPQAQALQPLALLAMAFPVAAAVGVLDALRLLVPQVFFYLLLRRAGISSGVGLAASLAFSLAGYLQGWLGWPLGGSATFLPLLLYGLVMVDERGARRDRLLLAAAAAATLLVGHPETELYVFVLAAVFGALRLRRRPAGRRLALLGAWLCALGIGAGAAAPALLPAVEFIPQTQRVEVLALRREMIRAAASPAEALRTPQARRETAAGLLQRLLPVAAPNAFGNNRFGSYWGNRNVINDTACFTGTAALLGFLLAFAPAGAGSRFPAERLLRPAAILSLLVVARPPGLIQLFDALPVVRESLSFHSRISLVIDFSIAYLAACSWERWRRGELRRGPVVLLACALAALVSWAYLAHPNPQDPSRLAALRFGSLAVHLLVLGSSCWALCLRPTGFDQARAHLPRLGLATLVGLVAGELLFIYAPANPSTPADLFYPAVPPIAYLASHLRPGERVAGLGPALRANFASVYGLADPRSSNPAKPASYLDAVRSINRSPIGPTDGFEEPLDPLYGLLGVRYLITPPRQALPPPLQRVFRGAAAWVYERPGALPRLFLPAAASACDAPSWSDCTAGIGDFADRAALRSRPGQAAAWAAADRAASWLAVSRLEATRIAWHGHFAEPRLLASSVYQDGGWTLLAGGRPVPETVANGPFVAAWLPPGEAAGDLLYRPPGFIAGMAIAAAALAGALALGTVPPGARRKRTAARSQTWIDGSA